MMKRGRGSSSNSSCAVALQDNVADRVVLPSAAPVVLGRRSFKSAAIRKDNRISRKQLQLVFDEKTGSVRATALAGVKNPSFRQDSGGAWVRLAADASLYDGDLIKLVSEAPALRVEITGRSVLYDKRARLPPECLYGLQCARRDDAAHAAKYSHSEPLQQ
jgi:hypothetical protein